MKREIKSKSKKSARSKGKKNEAELSELTDILIEDKSIACAPNILYTVRDACRMLKFGRSTIQRAIKEGHLESSQLGSRRVFTLTQLKAFAMKVVNGELSDGLFEKKA